MPRLRRRWLLGLGVLAFSFVPLAGSLSYFGGLALAPILALLATAAGVDAVRDLREAGGAPTGPEAHAALLRAGAIELAWLLGLPIALLTLGMLWNRNCDPLGGLAFFFMGPGFAAALGLVAGLWGGALGRPRLAQLGLGLLPFLGSIALGLWRLYTQPMVYAYSPMIGWFSGPIYAEAVSIGGAYLRFRAVSTLWIGGGLLALRPLLEGRGVQLGAPPPEAGERLRLGVAITLLAGATTFSATGERWGFETTAASTARRLSGTLETEHFVIRYAPGSADARDIELIAAEHEFAWTRLEALTGTAPEAPLTSFIYPTPEVKTVLFGAGNVEVSLPWKRQMYLRHLPYPHRVLHHELAHAFGAPSGDRVVGLSTQWTWRGPVLNGGLIEGWANALAPRSAYGLDLHDQAAALDRLDKRPPLGPMMGWRFWGVSQRRAYTAVGSFHLWLLETRGIEPLREVYRSGDFASAYGQSLESLEADWVEFLRGRELDDADVDAMKQRFKQRSIFRRPCAHRAASLGVEATLLRRQDQNEAAVEALQELCSIEPDAPQHQLRLADAHAARGDTAAAREALDAAASMKNLTHAIKASIARERAHVAMLEGDAAAVGVHLDEALGYAIDDGLRRTMQIERMVVDDPGAIPIVMDYLQPLEGNTRSTASAVRRLYAAIRLEERAGWQSVGAYLVARQLLNISDADATLEHLQLALAPDEGEPGLATPELRWNAGLMLLETRVRRHEWDEARAVLADLAGRPEVGSGERLDLRWWSERIDFYEDYFSQDEG